MRVIIVEDEVLVAEDLSAYVEQAGHLVVAIEHQMDKALKAIQTYQPDLVLLDIQLEHPDDGYRIARKLKEWDIDYFFMTAYSGDTALKKAIDLVPNGYFLKPFNPHQIRASLNTFTPRVKNIFSFKDGKNHISIPSASILYIEADNNYCTINTQDKRYLLRTSLNKLLVEINDSKIQRIHKSYAVNFSKITKRNAKEIYIEQTVFPLSKTYFSEDLL